jgi:hypothetical protein
VWFASHFLPHLRFGLHLKIAERAIPCRETPVPNSLEFAALAGSEEIVRLAEGSLEPGAAKKIVAPFQESRLEFDGQQFLDKGNILVHELLLEGDGVGRNDRLALRPHRVEGGRDEIG